MKYRWINFIGRYYLLRFEDEDIPDEIYKLKGDGKYLVNIKDGGDVIELEEIQHDR